MENNKTAGILLIFLSLLLIVGYFFSSTKIKGLEKENKELNNKIEKIDLLNSDKTSASKINEASTKVNDNTSTTKSTALASLDELKSFNENFVTHLNNNEDVEKNNESLKTMVNEDALNYLKENKYIYESNVSTESKTDSHDHAGAFDIKKVTIETTDVKNYFDVTGDNLVTGLTTYKVKSTIDGDTTIGNFIIKADYVNENGQWKVNKIYSISPVSDEKADEIFKS